MNDRQDKREFTRVPVGVNVQVIGEDVSIQGQSVDVSLKGLFVLCDPQLPVGAKCLVQVLLGDPDNPSVIQTKGKVVRQTESGLGIEITEIEGLESFDHLRNLVLYNTGQVEEELKNHAGIRDRG